MNFRFTAARGAQLGKEREHVRVILLDRIEERVARMHAVGIGERRDEFREFVEPAAHAGEGRGLGGFVERLVVIADANHHVLHAGGQCVARAAQVGREPELVGAEHRVVRR